MKKSVGKKHSPMKKSIGKKRSLKKSIVRIDTSKLDRYSLSKYGYSSKAKLVERREALKKAVKAYGHEKVWKKLNLVGILNKNRSPATSRVFITDKNWLKRTYF